MYITLLNEIMFSLRTFILLCLTSCAIKNSIFEDGIENGEGIVCRNHGLRQNNMASPESTTASKPDYRNGDLVSRLLAATPPYLYNMPLVPQSFFFSEMLRSFVQAKSAAANQNATNIGQRRGRKRSWRESKHPQSAVITDKPLELTTTTRSPPPPKPPCSPPIAPPPPNIPPPPPPMLLPPLPSQSNEIPTAPLWYPPIYTPPNLPPQPPPYSFDPLHFFIDLRVSGHIWDRKPDSTKDQMPSPCEPLNLQMEDKKNGLLSIDSTFRQRKHMSAFSVPQPRDSNAPNNNSISHINNLKEITVSGHKSTTNISTNYVLQNLTKIYQEVKASKESPSAKEEGSSQDEKKCKDIRELIGLELVVDYVNHNNGTADKDKNLVTNLKQETETTQDVAVD